MLKAILIFLFGIFCGFWFSWVAPGSILNHWIKGKDHPKNNTNLDNRDVEFHTGEENNVFPKQQLYNQEKVLCTVLTNPENHYRIPHIKATWGKRCDTLLFFSTVDDRTIPIISLPVAPGENFEWERTKESLMYVFSKHYLDQKHVDWVLMVDDETFVVVENLRYLLSSYNSYEALYFGRYMKPSNTSPEFESPAYGYMDGRAGYVLSKEAVRRLVADGFNGDRKCKQDEMIEDDLQMGKCMGLLNVKAGNSKDRLGRGRFFALKPSDYIRKQLKNTTSWDITNDILSIEGELDCCSDSAITFHQIRSSEMHALEYFLYQLHPYGMKTSRNSTN